MILDADTGQVVDVNPFLMSLLGYSYDELYGKHLWEIGCFKDVAASKAAFRTLQENEYIRYEDLPLETRDGRRIDVEFVSNVYLVDHAKVIQCNIRDITERKRMEEELRESERRYRAFFEQGMDGVVIIDPETTRFIELNDRVCRQLGYSREEFARLRLHEIEDVETAEEIKAHIRKVERDGSDRFETRQRTKQGEIRYVEVVAQSLKVAGHPVYLCVWRDMTERKQFNEKMLEQERKYRVLFEAAHDGIFLSDETGFVDCNQRGAEMYGLAKEDIIGRHPAGLSPERQPDGRLSAEVATEKDLAALNGGPQSFEWQYLRSDGLIRDAEIALNRVEMGGKVFLQAIFRDITDRRQAEEALRESEDKFSMVFKRAPAMAAITVLEDGTYLDVNDKFVEMSGFTREELLGKTSTGLGWLRTEDRPKVIEALQRQGNIPGLEITFYARDGRPIECLYNCELVTIGGVKRLLTMALDITERKQAEKALSQRESYLTAIIENQPGLVWLKDSESRFLAVNNAFARSCGKQRPEDVLGKTDLDIWPKELAEKYRADDKEVMTRGAPIVVEEPISEQGVRRWFETFKTPVFNVDGQVLGTSGYARDITGRKQAEEERTRLATAIEQASEGICITATDWLIQYINPAFDRMSGYNDREIIGEHSRILKS